VANVTSTPARESTRQFGPERDENLEADWEILEPGVVASGLLAAA
jgi:hypothetical protein